MNRVLAEQQRLAGLPITEEEDKYWRVEVDDRKVQWPIRVYYDIFGKGFADAIVQAPTAKDAIHKFATDRKRPLNKSFFMASPAKATDKPRKV